MPAKRKASLPNSPPSTKRKTRSGGAADVVVPLFDWDESSPPSPTKLRPPKQATDASISEHAPTEVDEEDNGSIDDLDMLSPRPTRSVPPRIGVASSSRTSSAGSPAPHTPSKSRVKYNIFPKASSSRRQVINADDEEDDEEEEEPVSPTKSRRPIRPLPSRTTKPRTFSTSSAASSGYDSPLKVSIALGGKGKARASVSSSSEGFVENLVDPDEEDDDGISRIPSSPSKRAGARMELGPLSPNSHRLLDAQRKAILKSLLKPPIHTDTTDEASKHSPLQSLISLLQGSTERGEGNSCLVLGPRGSGKTRVGRVQNGPILFFSNGPYYPRSLSKTPLKACKTAHL